MKRVLMLFACLLLAGTAFGCSKTTPETAEPLAKIGEAAITESKHEREEGYKDPLICPLKEICEHAIH